MIVDNPLLLTIKLNIMKRVVLFQSENIVGFIFSCQFRFVFFNFLKFLKRLLSAKNKMAIYIIWLN